MTMPELFEGLTCDWPKNGSSCSAPAEWFVNEGPVHRPICGECKRLIESALGPTVSAKVFWLAHADLKKIPGAKKQAPRAEAPPPAAEDREVEEILGRGHNVKTDPPPAPDMGSPSRPPLRDVLIELGSSLAALAVTVVDKVERQIRLGASAPEPSVPPSRPTVDVALVEERDDDEPSSHDPVFRCKPNDGSITPFFVRAACNADAHWVVRHLYRNGGEWPIGVGYQRDADIEHRWKGPAVTGRHQLRRRTSDGHWTLWEDA